MARKPYRSLTGFDQFGDEWDYKDLIKKSLTSEDTVDTLASTGSTIIYSIYSLPLTAKGDILTHDGSAAVVKHVGANKTALVADSSTTDGLAWRTLNTTKGDLLGYDTDLKRVPIGTNYYALLANSGVALGLAWTALTTTKGDILTHDGTTPLRRAVGTEGYILQSQAAEATGLGWATKNSLNLGLGGNWIYGDGADNDLTLASDTTMGDDDFIKNYNDVDLAGYSLVYHSNNFYGLIFANGTFDGNGGTFHSHGRSAGVIGAGGVGASLASGGGGGLGSGSVYAYGKTMVDVTISSKGNVGSNGADRNTPTVNDGLNVVGGNASGTSLKFRAANVTFVQATGATSAAPSIGGTKGSVTVANRLQPLLTSKDLFRIVFPSFMSGSSTMVAIDSNLDGRHTAGAAGGGGASGAKENDAPATARSGGGGGGGGTSVLADGGNGGNATNASATLGTNTAGGGGGGGGGGEAHAITDDGSNVVVTANGGAGGNGGTISDNGSKAGGGGGGGGCLAVGIGSGITVTATGGAGGTETGGGASGGAGGTGRAYQISRA